MGKMNDLMHVKAFLGDTGRDKQTGECIPSVDEFRHNSGTIDGGKWWRVDLSLLNVSEPN